MRCGGSCVDRPSRIEVERDEEKCCKVRGVLHLPKQVEEDLRRAGGFERLKERIPTADLLEAEAKGHQALADPLRLSILHSLSACDLCPCVLKELTRLSDSKLSYHLNILEEAGLVSSYPSKKWRIYSISEKGRRALI